MKCAGETFIPFFIIRKHTFKMNSSFKIVLLFSFILFSLNFKPCSSACARAEYETGDEECCPLCAPGKRLKKDCTEMNDTVCVQCMDKTFLDVYNNQTKCFNCRICDPGKGLRVKTACTRTSNAVCEPLQGYYCTHESRGSCIRTHKHTKCHPGEFIKHMGSADKDAVCERCAGGTFSNGTLQNCEPHTKCEDQGLREVEAGTSDSDTVCGNKPQIGLIAGIISFIVLALVALLVFLIVTKRIPFTLPFTLQRTDRDAIRSPQQESAPESVVLRKTTQSDSSYNSDPEIPLRMGPQETSVDEFTNTVSPGQSGTYSTDDVH